MFPARSRSAWLTYSIGDQIDLPDDVRLRAWQVKNWCKQGLRPEKLIVQLTTGASIVRQETEAEARGPKSITWEKARAKFLAEVERIRRPRTYDDYRKTLCNTPELRRLEGCSVALITDVQIATIYAAIHQRNESMAEHVARIVSAMWTWLSEFGQRAETGVQPFALRGVKPPERTRSEVGDGAEEDAAPPQLAEEGVDKIATALTARVALDRRLPSEAQRDDLIRIPFSKSGAGIRVFNSAPNLSPFSGRREQFNAKLEMLWLVPSPQLPLWLQRRSQPETEDS